MNEEDFPEKGQRALASQSVPMPRGDASLVRQGYSQSEIEALYALARTFLASGETGPSERMSKGIVSVAPEFAPAWLMLAYIYLMQENRNETIFSARQALRAQPNSVEALLFLVIAYFQAEDFQTGGTFLGEVAELVHGERGTPELRRLYDSQVIRFEERLKQGSKQARRKELP